MTVLWIRSIIFELFYLPLTIFFLIVLMFCMALPRPLFVQGLCVYFRLLHQLEKNILGLNYRVLGLENLPKSGSYLVAAKHFSTYETLKLCLLLPDPAAILKRELFWIPIWGWLAWRSGHVCVDRSKGARALKHLSQEALRVKAEGRPIVIFPQGTRISVHETVQDRPYKNGIARMYEMTGLPVIPLALNTGLFWPRKSFLKHPGCVTFKFLPPIPPGLPTHQMMKRLESQLEEETTLLLKQENPS